MTLKDFVNVARQLDSVKVYKGHDMIYYGLIANIGIELSLDRYSVDNVTFTDKCFIIYVTQN